jgi:hypothetical protein
LSGNWGAALSAFGPLIIGMLIAFVMCAVLLIFGIRWMTKGKIACSFHKNKKKAGALLKYDAENVCVWLGKDSDPNREKYDVVDDAIELIDWPGMLPHFFCVTIRSLEYVRGNPTPINLEKRTSTNITAKALRLQSDGNVLQAVYLHARQALGAMKKQTVSTMVLLLLVGTLALSLFGVWKNMQTSSETIIIKTQLQTIQNALGVGTQPVTGVTTPTTTTPPGGKP